MSSAHENGEKMFIEMYISENELLFKFNWKIVPSTIKGKGKGHHLYRH